MPTAWRREPVPTSVVPSCPWWLLRYLWETATLGTYKERGEPKQGPYPKKKEYIFMGGVLQLRQLHARISLADRTQELPHGPGTVASWLDKSGHHGCTPEICGIRNIDFFILSRFISGFSAFRSWKSPTASSSTEYKAAACWTCWIVSPPSCRFFFFFWPAGGSYFCFCVAGRSSWDDMAEGISERRDDVLVKFSGWDRSADCDLGRGIWYGRWYFFR